LAEAQAEGNPLRFGVDYSVDAIHGRSGGPQLRTDRTTQNIKFVVADGLNLPFVDQAFDVVVGHVSMPYMNTRSAMQEIYRVLAPGGSVFLTFHSFHFVRRWCLDAMRRRALKELIRCAYITSNGLLNHFAFPQVQAWWNRRDFETVSTPEGVCLSAHNEGFVLIATEHAVGKIFFSLTARKPNRETAAVLPPPGWASDFELAGNLTRTTCS